MSYERCPACEHLWHGLSCQAKHYVQVKQRWERVACECPSLWSESTTLVEGHAVEVHVADTGAAHDVGHGVALVEHP